MGRSPLARFGTRLARNPRGNRVARPDPRSTRERAFDRSEATGPGSRVPGSWVPDPRSLPGVALRDAEARARASRDESEPAEAASGAEAEAESEPEPERSSSPARSARWMDLRAETSARAPVGFADAPFARPTPPITRRLPGEPAWTEAFPSPLFSGLGLGPSPAWDPGFGFESETRARVAALRMAVAEATRAPLVPTRQNQVLAAIESARELVHRAGLSPDTLPALVRHNPAVAAECLLRLGAASSEDGSYRDALVRIRPVSLHSMEVVNRLANAAELPIDFVKSYVGNCVQSCVEETDAGMRNRLVRLVCMFLQVLIRNRRVRVADLPEEVQAFCVEFMQSKEAATLFRLLRTHEGEGGGGGGDPDENR